MPGGSASSSTTRSRGGSPASPGTCLNYSHADFILLGRVLRKVTGEPVAKLMRERIFKPIGLTHTSISRTAAIASPVLHAYSTRTTGGPLEDSTFWNPSWTIGKGEVMTANLRDEARAAPRDRDRPAPVAEGLPRADLSTARHQGRIRSSISGLGLVVANSWIVQNPNISGYVGIQAYLPSKRTTIVIECHQWPAHRREPPLGGRDVRSPRRLSRPRARTGPAALSHGARGFGASTESLQEAPLRQDTCAARQNLAVRGTDAQVSRPETRSTRRGAHERCPCAPAPPNGGFPEPWAGAPVQLIRATHEACGGTTLVRLPPEVPSRAVRVVVCGTCQGGFRGS